MLQRVSHLDRDVDRPGEVEWPLLADEVAEVCPLDELEDDVVPAVLAANRVDAADILVVETGRRLGLVAEPLQHLLVVGLATGKDLDGNGAVKRRVERTEDGPHAAATDELVKPVGTEHRALEGPADIGGRSQSARCRPRRGTAPGCGRWPARDHGGVFMRRHPRPGTGGVV